MAKGEISDCSSLGSDLGDDRNGFILIIVMVT